MIDLTAASEALDLIFCLLAQFRLFLPSGRFEEKLNILLFLLVASSRHKTWTTRRWICSTCLICMPYYYHVIKGEQQ